MSARKLEKKLIRSTTSCSNCGKDPEPLKPFSRCAKCRFPSYCSKECQKVHWKAHKKVCSASIEEKDVIVEAVGKDWTKFADDWRGRMADGLFFLAKSEVGESRRRDHVLWNSCVYDSTCASPRIVITDFKVLSFSDLRSLHGDGIIERIRMISNGQVPSQDVNYYIFNLIQDIGRPQLDPYVKISHIGIGTVQDPVRLTRTSQDYVDDINADNFAPRP